MTLLEFVKYSKLRYFNIYFKNDKADSELYDPYTRILAYKSAHSYEGGSITDYTSEDIEQAHDYVKTFYGENEEKRLREFDSDLLCKEIVEFKVGTMYCIPTQKYSHFYDIVVK